SLDEHEVAIGTSIGIAYDRLEQADADALLKHADLALYRAKADGRGTFQFFDQALNAQMKTRQTLASGLRSALTNSEFELNLQPIIDATTMALVRFEALLRWRHPKLGLIRPSEFIPLAEEIGLIVPVGEWVIREACRLATNWPAGIAVAVNLSAAQLRSVNL